METVADPVRYRLLLPLKRLPLSQLFGESGTRVAAGTKVARLSEARPMPSRGGVPSGGVALR